MLPFLPQDESLNMQATNRFHYQIAVSRVCTTFDFSQPLLPYFDDVPGSGSYSNTLFFHDVANSQKYIAMAGLKDFLGVVQAG